MQILHPDTAHSSRELTGGGVRQTNGTPRRHAILGVGGVGTPNAYRCLYGEGPTGGELLSPRHRHTFDQFRFFMAGEYKLADTVIPAGQVGYFPESVFYGPQLIQAGVTIFDVQFGGSSGTGFITPGERPEAMRRLIEKGGKFEDGFFVTYDENGEKHLQDGFEALQEEIRGYRVKYAEPRYTDQVFMIPDNYEWTKDPDQPGVGRKLLGSFTERDTRVGFIQLDAGASFTFGYEQAPEVLFINEGAVSYQGESHPRLSALSTDLLEGPFTITADELTELLYIKLPTF
jgi:hypothetical protein